MTMTVGELIHVLNDYPMDTEVDLVIDYRARSAGSVGYKAPLTAIVDNPIHPAVNLVASVPS